MTVDDALYEMELVGTISSCFMTRNRIDRRWSIADTHTTYGLIRLA